MCNLKSAGGRCHSHAVQALEVHGRVQERNLAKEAKEAGVPIDRQFVEDGLSEFDKKYDKDRVRATEVKAEMLDAHAKGLEAKAELENPSLISKVFSYDTKSTAKRIYEKVVYSPVGWKDDPYDNPYLTNLETGEHYEVAESFIDASNYRTAIQNMIDEEQTDLKERQEKHDESLRRQVIKENPHLRELQKEVRRVEKDNVGIGPAVNNARAGFRSKVDNFIQENGYKTGKQTSFPEQEERLKKLREEYASADEAYKAQAENLRAFHHQRMTKHNESVKERFYKKSSRAIEMEAEATTYKVEMHLKNTPPLKSYRQLKYNHYLNVFKAKKAEYKELSNSTTSKSLQKRREREEKSLIGKAPFDSKALAAFESGPYQELESTKKLAQEEKALKLDLQVTRTYRGKLLNHIQAEQDKGVDVTPLLDKLRKLTAISEQRKAKAQG